MTNLHEITEDLVAWQRKTFPSATNRSTLFHLASEIGEYVAATEIADSRQAVANEVAIRVNHSAKKPSSDPAGEVADIYILVVQLADCLGISLVEAVQQKLEENKSRLWKAPDEQGVIEHKT
jgi:NTP pyrophosphatase (non-canonical NTP hydrolase)